MNEKKIHKFQLLKSWLQKKLKIKHTLVQEIKSHDALVFDRMLE